MAKQVRLISLLCNRTGASLLPAGSHLHHLLIDLQPVRCQQSARLLVSYGGTLSEAASPQQQFKVLKPAGGGRPVLRSPMFAVVELGAAQYKVSAGDLVIAERLKGLDVGAEILLERVQAAGSHSETLIGRPYVEGTSVTATVEEQLQDAKVISFKKRRRKNSRRIKGHRQLLTALRITGVHGITAGDGAQQQLAVS